jgi:hypothetical protein
MRSLPLKRIAPETIFPAGLGTKRKMERAVTLFPLPDSPTNPRVLLQGMDNETPSTARTTPAPVKKKVRRSIISSRLFSE